MSTYLLRGAPTLRLFPVIPLVLLYDRCMRPARPGPRAEVEGRCFWNEERADRMAANGRTRLSAAALVVA